MKNQLLAAVMITCTAQGSAFVTGLGFSETEDKHSEKTGVFHLLSPSLHPLHRNVSL